jgi:hypothetical protein
MATMMNSNNDKVDVEGFHYKYVPKSSIIVPEEQISPPNKKG